MHPAPDHFILRVSCPAVSGIVAAVTTYLAEHGCYISEMAQFDDEDNGRFFMRAVFRYNTGITGDTPQLEAGFADVAQRFAFGTRNFKRRFKDATGYTPLAYLQALRLEKAKQLLESTRMTLDSITYAVGYEDSNSFRRLFLQRVGLLPAAYRKQFQPSGS